MRAIKPSLTALALAILLAACAAREAPGPEPTPATEDGRQITVEQRWSTGIGEAADDAHRLQPAMAGGHLVMAAGNGRVVAMDPATGDERWAVNLNAPIAGGPGADDELIAVGTSDGEVIALSAADGEVQWQARVSSEVLAPPAVGQGHVVVRSADGRVFALDADSGDRRWLFSRSVPALSLRGHSSPVLVRNGVVAGFDNGRLSALSLDSGEPAWEATVAAPQGRTDLERMVDVDADPLVHRGELFAGAYQGRVVGINLADGEIAWARGISSLGGLAVDQDKLYATDEQGRIWALDRSNGASVWRADDLEGSRLGSPAVHGEYLVVGSADGQVHWFHRNDGRLVARYRLGNAPIVARPIVEADRVIVVDLSGNLEALTTDHEN